MILLEGIIAAGTIPLIHLFCIRVLRLRRYGLLCMYPALVIAPVLWIFIVQCIHGVLPDAQQAIASLSLIGFLSLGYLEIILKLYRGFSYSLLTDVFRHEGISLQEIRENYADGMGDSGMLAKRLLSMKNMGLIQMGENRLTLTRFGRVVARTGLLYKQLLNMGKGG